MRIKMVITQIELENIPDDFKGTIQIWGGDCVKPIEVNRRYDNSSVIAMGNSFIEVKDDCSVEAWDNSFVISKGQSSVVAHNNSYVEVHDNSSVIARDDSVVLACDNGFVTARDNSFVKVIDDCSVIAVDNSSVIACGNSSVELGGHSQVRIMSNVANCKVLDNSDARIIHLFETAEDYARFYKVQQDDTSLIMYKAVHKYDEDMFIDDCDESIVYVIGEKTIEDTYSYTEENCAAGLYVSMLNTALLLGVHWNDLAIIECKVPKDEIVVPNFSEGGVRTSELTVIREVPLIDCGPRGRVFAKMRGEYTTALEELKLRGMIKGLRQKYKEIHEEIAVKMLKQGMDKELIEKITAVTITNVGGEDVVLMDEED